jgi:hypothetical protein
MTLIFASIILLLSTFDILYTLKEVITNASHGISSDKRRHSSVRALKVLL